VANEVSGFCIAQEVALTYGGMKVAIPEETWKPFQTMDSHQFGSWLGETASRVDMKWIRKAKRGPKKPKVKPVFDPKHPHVSTARLLAAKRAAKAKQHKTK
jgi:hypothetical protein